MGEKTVVLDAAKKYTVCEFEDRAISEGKNQDLLREVKKNSSDSTYADFEQYKILEKTGLMVSFYDIIDWFNKEYLKIKEEAKTLPKIELEVDKWELGKKEKVLFNFLRCGEESIAFSEDPINLNGIFHREITIQDNLQNLFYQDKVTEDDRFSLVLKCIGVHKNSHKKIDGLDQNIMRQYRTIVDKYYNYLKAYEYFTKRSNRLSKAIFNTNQHTTINAGIYGGDPFRNLEQIAISFGQGGNEPAYYVTYNLGAKTLEKPIFYFDEVERYFNPEFKVLDKDDILNNNYHEVAKTLKLCKTYLPFEIKTSE